MSDSWKKLGIDSDGGFRCLLYSNVSEKIFINVDSEQEGVIARKLYARGIDEKQYIQVSDNFEGLSFQDPIFVSNEEQILVNVFQAKYEGGICKNEWRALALIDADTLECTHDVFGKKEIVKYGGAWIAQLHNATNDKGRLFCTAAFLEGAETDKVVVEYWLCELMLDSSALTRISKLEGTFL